MSVVRGMGRWAAVGVVLGVLSGSAVGQDTQQPIDGRPAVSETVTADTAAAVFERLERRLQIERDGRATQTTAARIRIRDSSALASLGHLYFSYVPVLETIELVVVKVDKANGQQIAVDAAALKDVPTPESGSFEGPTFTDARVKQVAVPALSVGDALSYEYVLRRHTPLAQGHFWTEYTFTRAAIVLEESFELDWPADLSLSVHAAVGPVEQTGLIARTGRILRRWTHSQQQLTAKDQAALRKLSVAAGNGKAPLPDIQVSTFETWDQVASWYGALTADAETPSPEVRDKARSLMQSAAVALRSGSDGVRERLRERVAALDGGAPQVAWDPKRGAIGPGDPRTVKIGRVGPARGTAEVMLVIDADGRVAAAKAVGSAGSGSVVISGLHGVKVLLDAPDPTPFRIVARAAVSCSEAPVTCTLTLFRPEDALRLKVD